MDSTNDHIKPHSTDRGAVGEPKSSLGVGAIHIPLVDLTAQYLSIKAEMDWAIQDILDRTAFIGGEDVKRFATDFAAYCNANFCVPCANGTDAIELALMALGIGKGDEVIIPAFSFAATLEAVVNVGATPVLCDIDPERYTLDPEKAIALVTEKTKAFIPVHLYGQMADMAPLMAFAFDHQMFVIEDAAQAHGAEYKGYRAGSMGDMATFSFYPGKNLGAYGDAGAITTNSEWLYNKSFKMANHGRTTKYEHEIVGRNSRLDTLQAAILSVKLKHLEAWTEKRRMIARRYDNLLKNIGQVKRPRIYTDSPGVHHLYVVRVEPSIRETLRSFLKSKGIETGIHYPVSLSKLKVTTGPLNIHVDCPLSEQAAEEVLSLPIYPELTEGQQDYVVEQLQIFFNH